MNENSNSSSLSQPNNNATPTLGSSMASCLRNSSKKSAVIKPCTSRHVTFPEDDSKLITGYLEPANPWAYADCRNPEELITLYKSSCEKHKTEPLASVIVQIKAMDLELARNECLSLKGEIMLPIQFEPLEEILKRVQFKTIDVEATTLNDEAAVALFDMLEYYESATYLNISCNKEIGSRGWHACSRMIKKTQCLERIDAKNVLLNEQHMPILARALRISTQLQILKLENCWLSGRPIIILAAALRLNTGLKELYLADNDLGITDAIQLGSILRTNYTLQLLDVSNNNIQDTGVSHISDGLIDQVPTTVGGGLGILVLWNNRLTRNCSKHFSRALALSKTLGMLNIGHNVLTNECLHTIKDSLQQNRTLLRLGMQSTNLTCEGAIALAECIADHPMIQRIDLRDNSLEVAGLMALTLSMKVNVSVTQLDIDDTPKRKLINTEAEQYRLLLSEIRGYCTRNEQAPQEDLDTVQEHGTPERRVRLKSISSRKISLTCETLLRNSLPPEVSNQFLTEPKRTGGRLRSPAPSPIPSPVSSPLPSPSRTRFSVVKVSELSTSSASDSSSVTTTSPRNFFPSPSNSRFHVSKVETDHCPATITSPSGNNVTLGFTFDDKTVASPVNLPLAVNSNNKSITCMLVPEISVKDASFSCSQDKTDDYPLEDLEVRRIMDGDSCGEISHDNYQKSNSISGDSPKLQHIMDLRQGNGIRVSDSGTASTSSQRTRKISRIQEPLQITEEKVPTNLEKLMGLFNPGMYFNKTQSLKETTAADTLDSGPLGLKGGAYSIEKDDTLEAVENLTILDAPVSSSDSPLPDIINNNNNNNEASGATMISLNVTIDDSCCDFVELPTHCKEDENFNRCNDELEKETSEEDEGRISEELVESVGAALIPEATFVPYPSDLQ